MKIENLQKIFDAYFDNPSGYADYVIINGFTKGLEPVTSEMKASNFFGTERRTIDPDDFPFFEGGEYTFGVKEVQFFKRDGDDEIDYPIEKRTIIFTLCLPKETKELYKDANKYLQEKKHAIQEQKDFIQNQLYSVSKFFTYANSFLARPIEIESLQHLTKTRYVVSMPHTDSITDDILFSIADSYDGTTEDLKKLFSGEYDSLSEEELDRRRAEILPCLNIERDSVKECYGDLEPDEYIEEDEILKDYFKDIFELFNYPKEKPFPKVGYNSFSLEYSKAKNEYDHQKRAYPALRLYEEVVRIDGTILSCKLLENNNYFEN